MTSIYDPLVHIGVSWIFQATILASAILFLAAMSIRNSLASEDGGVLPDDGVTIRNLFEVIVVFLADLAESTMGEDWRKHFPVVVTIFFFILISNLMNLVPWITGATANINTALAWALIAFVYYNYLGIKTHGWKYVFQFMGPVFFDIEIGGKTYHIRPMTPIFLPLELLLHAARVVTLTVRLLANMFADHTVVMIWITQLGVAIVVPAIFMGLGLIVSLLQAFVFSLLTMIYIGGALEEAH